MTLNSKRLIAVQPETLPSGSNSVSAPKDTLVSFASLARLAIVTVQQTVVHSCLVFLATATSTPKFATLKLVGASASTTPPATIAISALEDIMETLWEVRRMIV